ncbi:hypothetical protein THAOC_13160 [Thalassiosira oceanica]|uniref:Mannosyltransferase n=1 Tax=Thalassiosira oceanica TaxID=159749 RepID=K0SKT3_THAOC|nr:hypothetical protein THAOC_13160 [Thalassiosira oceanica]|mmetsp:Transcript_38084/g.91117  ORF Transcript_38084/g.91117 Transcript_38084/m.91117 type:complete len:638 (+) Transcript_38084:130-2043(+)|eukprot:EJK65940.1 hypothetical protein THAOC_13160 [Thalassiosira oceanica]
MTSKDGSTKAADAADSSSVYRLGSAISTLYIAVRIGTANLSPITDCDEVYNYWEPLHFLLYKTGMQTWEYAPQYALRTYAYIMPMAIVAKIYQSIYSLIPIAAKQQLSALLLGTASSSMLEIEDKPLLFATLRSTLAFISCYSELRFFRSVHMALVDKPNLAHYTALASLSAGFFHSNQAYLPSSTVMTLTRFSMASQLQNNDAWAIGHGLLAVLAVGWPFCAVLFITTGFYAIWKGGLEELFFAGWNSKNDGSLESRLLRAKRAAKSIVYILLRTLALALVIHMTVETIDFSFYGKRVTTLTNIFVYNASSGGDELYGVEPMSFYIKNILLNFNYVGLLGVLALPLLAKKAAIVSSWSTTFNRGVYRKSDSRSGYTMLVYFLILIPMYLWLGIVLPRPHKEERFLFPVYPMLCFGAAVVIDELTGMIMYILELLACSGPMPISSRSNKVKLSIGLILLAPSAIVSTSRSMALYHYYHAPLKTYRELFHHAAMTPESNGASYVCTAGEWYRYPSSFFLPPTYKLGFLKSSFSGQLPQPFNEGGNFNDANTEEMDRYVEISECMYVVELVPSSTNASAKEKPEGLQYMEADEGSWELLSSHNYLDSEGTPLVDRILYLPWRNKGNYSRYNLYTRKTWS